MDKYTVKELKKIASKQKIRGRSKMNKAELYDVLKDIIDKFDDMKLENKEENVEDYLVEKIESMSLEDDSKLKSTNNIFNMKSYIKKYSNYDYVIVDCPSTSEAFPVLVDNPGNEESDIKWNDFMYHFFGSGYVHDQEGVWVTTTCIQGPIGLKSGLNSPMEVEFEKYTTKNGKKKISYATVFPFIDPKIVGYQDILDCYAIFDIENDYYHIEGIKVNDFCKEIIKRSIEWSYIPDFVLQIEKALKIKNIDFTNKIIFADIKCKELEELQEILFDYPMYNDCRITQFDHFKTSDDLYIAYMKLE